jgi:hypothetical protein
MTYNQLREAVEQPNDLMDYMHNKRQAMKDAKGMHVSLVN